MLYAPLQACCYRQQCSNTLLVRNVPSTGSISQGWIDDPACDHMIQEFNPPCDVFNFHHRILWP
uniref:Uncharacterized protein n=1 Tax=Arundo donax TaxID=35708 RepID=A0A0A9H7U9_ARUDO